MPKVEEDKTTRKIVPMDDKIMLEVSGDFKQSFTFQEILGMKNEMENKLKQSEQAIDDDFLKFHKKNIAKIQEEMLKWKPAFDAAEAKRAVEMKKMERKATKNAKKQ